VIDASTPVASRSGLVPLVESSTPIARNVLTVPGGWVVWVLRLRQGRALSITAPFVPSASSRRGELATQYDVDPTVRATVVHLLEHAEFFLREGREAEFQQTLRRARAVEMVGPASLVRGRWLARHGRIDAAVVELEALLARGRLNAEPRLFVAAGSLLAGILQAVERDAEANRILQRVLAAAIEHDLFDAPLMGVLGVAARRRGDPEAALRLLNTAYSIAEEDETTAAALSELGHLHLAERRHPEALACLWRAYRMHAEQGDDLATARDLLGLGDLAWATGRRRIAGRAWHAAVDRLHGSASPLLAARLDARLKRVANGGECD
jgi:tetratricopeptide (TPR) repeat protein